MLTPWKSLARIHTRHTSKCMSTAHFLQTQDKGWGWSPRACVQTKGRETYLIHRSIPGLEAKWKLSKYLLSWTECHHGLVENGTSRSESPNSKQANLNTRPSCSQLGKQIRNTRNLFFALLNAPNFKLKFLCYFYDLGLINPEKQRQLQWEVDD